MSSHEPVTVTAHRHLKATPEQLFSVVLDSSKLARVAGVAKVEVISAGPDGPMSVGTTRRVQLVGGLYLIEEFVGLDAPHTFDYRLHTTSAPVDHRFGRISFHRVGDITEGTWSSTYAIPVPRLGAVATHTSRPAIKAAFFAALGALDAFAQQEESAR